MKKTLTILVIVFGLNSIKAQFIKEKAINAQIGYALSSPYNSINEVVNDGFFLQGELVLKISSWVQLRPYAGLVLTNSDGRDIYDNPTEERAETKAFLLGGKARVKAPIPWVSPYVELGIGTSIGKFETFTFFDDIDNSGIIYHIPFSFGLELGRNHEVDLGLAYYFQPSVEQFAGAFAIGLTFPLNRSKSKQ